MKSLLSWLFILQTLVLTTAMGYDQLCSVDPLLPREFPVANRRSLLRTGDQQHRVIEAIVEHEEKIEESSETVEFFRCICNYQNFHDERTTHAYCPLHYSCGIPFDKNAPAECVDMKLMNGIARMAWPIFITSALCLTLIMFASMYGLTVWRFISKRFRRRETVEDVERQEVEELLHLSRQPPQPQPSRCHVREHQIFQYHKYILDRARVGFRREWNDYKANLKPPTLRLPTKIYDGSKANYKEATEPLDNPHLDMTETEDEVTCSICFAELEVGQRIGDLPCRHYFHSSCLKTWLATGRRNACPLCQSPNIAIVKDQNGSSTLSEPTSTTAPTSLASSVPSSSSLQSEGEVSNAPEEEEQEGAALIDDPEHQPAEEVAAPSSSL
mmetsp:Transcript_103295/g.298786  ORF Transcript_103295/g.298786 Transcript_103295/m.298786 type:complete len:385 (+) Transcript_103295:41-1195(+)